MINNCTFSQRSAAENINRHPGSAVCCNPVQPAGGYSNAAPLEPNRSVIENVGGTQTHITNSAFYGKSNVILLPYPNINACPVTSGLTPADILMENNYFKLPTCSLCTLTNDDCNTRVMVGTNLKGVELIKIRAHEAYNHWVWDFLNPLETNLTIGEIAQNTCQSGVFDAASLTPVAVISSGTWAGNLSTLNKMINVGGSLYFDTNFSLDGSLARRNVKDPLSNLQVNLWWLHQLQKDLMDEVRTLNTTAPFKHIFNKIGITNVTLMSMDETLNKASDLAKQLITVKPNGIGGPQYLTFNIKDTYTGRELSSIPIIGSCDNLVEDVINSAAPTVDPANPTGFQKYARISVDQINWIDVWVDDIDGDDNWQYIIVNLGPHMVALGNFCDMYVEIGLRAVPDASGNGPSASRVRGVTVYIDDVYINDTYGYNALQNGDFELQNTPPSITQPTDPYPASWVVIDEKPAVSTYPVVTASGCLPWPNDPNNQIPWCTTCADFQQTFVVSSNSGGLSTTEPRSGFLGFAGYIKPFGAREVTAQPHIPNTGILSYTIYNDFERYYNVGYYKAVRNKLPFRNNSNNCTPPDPKRLLFTLSPVPVTDNAPLTVTLTSEPDAASTRYTITVTDAQGHTAMLDHFTGNQFVFTQNLAPGVYTITINDSKKHGYAKYVVVK